LSSLSIYTPVQKKRAMRDINHKSICKNTLWQNINRGKGTFIKGVSKELWLSG
jgi:hypothetical protein